jgi:hypothetical protein
VTADLQHDVENVGHDGSSLSKHFVVARRDSSHSALRLIVPVAAYAETTAAGIPCARPRERVYAR